MTFKDATQTFPYFIILTTQKLELRVWSLELFLHKILQKTAVRGEMGGNNKFPSLTSSSLPLRMAAFSLRYNPAEPHWTSSNGVERHIDVFPEKKQK